MKLVDFLFEVGDTTLPMNWIQHGAGETADFEYKQMKFRIMIEADYDEELNKIFHDKKIGFASFLYEYEPLKYTQDTTNLAGGNASTVFAIVKNALKDKFVDYDIMFFAAKRKTSPQNYESRERLFKHIFFKIARETGLPHYSIPSQGGYVYVFSKEQIDDQIKLIQDNYTF